jgi:hypothetical protein
MQQSTDYLNMAQSPSGAEDIADSLVVLTRDLGDSVRVLPARRTGEESLRAGTVFVDVVARRETLSVPAQHVGRHDDMLLWLKSQDIDALLPQLVPAPPPPPRAGDLEPLVKRPCLGSGQPTSPTAPAIVSSADPLEAEGLLEIGTDSHHEVRVCMRMVGPVGQGYGVLVRVQASPPLWLTFHFVAWIATPRVGHYAWIDGGMMCIRTHVHAAVSHADST